MSVEEIFQLIQCRGSVTQEKKEVDLGRLRVLLSQNKGVVEAVRLLLQAGASPAAVDKAGYTPLHWAAGKGHEKVVEDLLKHNADANAADKNGLTPLHRAAYWGQTACIKELLYKGGADPNVQDHLQHTPFMMAAWFGKIDSAREIFEKLGLPIERTPTTATLGGASSQGDGGRASSPSGP
ncbi:cd4-specific ankyrin repeat protein [Nannochloropsis gaditana CCMP526]|uniref:cd4-specific ankyrin repeat protein n=1 Tax=Nannochloropsis gaditana (strain CCMP526) TaxID=1093141 RepID=UPI00029F60CC|nr:cd4-specific ankyrin repeat protein [Nannochloropsis gaditana CCMP526]XP_005854472.1 cd4-specific ankyrin repeat protein [Nannochloropsis gaditana CCMP526]EKU21889.1 cd4-specific ankyrin repeat protein [Nannochloropsis gaditana CCMP526]EKU23002.1 cd4-specific ankyrin repeat protein [Nannochloropsis gaditana CCMP526]|eukprot:XP_005853359.1 cd4-specific ankyrin repeat protein [Nannochloropsis gaditana CCMP526]